MVLQATKIFNPEGSDRVEDRQIWGGNTTNLMNLNNVKYKWGLKLYRQMRDNFWIPEKVDLSQDVVQYKELTPDEKRGYDGILSYLTFLDSVQTCNLSYIKAAVTAPEIEACLGKQIDQEILHNQSYQVIIETLLPKENMDDIYDYWRTDSVLLARCKHIAELYQQYVDDPLNDEKYFNALYADYLLESIYFYMGFNFFHSLASRQLMNGSNDMITYIKKDEYTHVLLYQNLIKEAMQIFPHSKDYMYEMMSDTLEQEKKWVTHITQDNVLGISEKSTEQYLNWLGNKRLKAIGLDEIFDAPSKNPYQHLDAIGDQSSEANLKSNFFEATVTAYNQSTALSGWDDF